MPIFHPGAVCGRYTILGLIGEGEVAEVYAAMASPSERLRLALKIIREQAPLDSVQQARMAHEAEATSMIVHVNVVRFYDIGVHDQRVWIGRELVDGSDLRQLVHAAGGKLPVERAVSLILQACEGICAAHRQKIIHRDLKPDNILVTRDDLVKVGDFGSAKLPAWGARTTASMMRTDTVRYMAPDLMLHADAPTPLADVYSMGVILYELILGANPFMIDGNASYPAICKRQLEHDPPLLHTICPAVMQDLSYLLQRAMVKDPAQRCSMREFADGLEFVLQRSLVWQRNAARSVPLPHKDSRLALTERAMRMWDALPPSSPPTSSPPLGSARGGTIPMAVFTGGAPPASSAGDTDRTPPPTFSSPQPFTPRSADLSHDTDRDALPPPAPSSLPTTLRTPRTPAPDRAVPPPSLPASRAAAPVSAPRAPTATAPEPAQFGSTLASQDVSPLATSERGSTGVPVESAARPSFSKPRAVRVAAAGAALVVLAAAVWWTVFAREAERPRVVAQAAAPASASAPPPAALSASAFAPPSGAPHKEPVRRPAPPRPKPPSH